MAAKPVRLILLPRFTALHGAATFLTTPVRIADFASVNLTAWLSTGLGATPATATFQLQQSTDLSIWEDVGSSFTPASAGTEITVGRDLALEWMRLKIVVSTLGSNPGVTAWVVGVFVPRDDARETRG
jgi:hypothetical protein